MWHLPEEEELHSRSHLGPGNVLALRPEWLQLHQVFWPLGPQTVTVLSIDEVRLHSFPLCSAAGVLLDDLECWPVGLGCYSITKVLFYSMKATPAPFLPPGPEPHVRYRPASS